MSKLIFVAVTVTAIVGVLAAAHAYFKPTDPVRAYSDRYTEACKASINGIAWHNADGSYIVCPK